MTSQFPRPWQPVRGSYERVPPSKRWRFNEKDAADTLSFVTLAQPVILAVAAEAEALVGRMQPETSSPIGSGVTFFVTWILSTFGMAIFRGLIAFVRQRGASILEDIFAWCVRQAWDFVKDYLPFRGRFFSRRLPRPKRNEDPPSLRRRNRVRDWWRERHNRNRGDR